jgi:NADH-quinone oxidoreductase subunit G
MEEMSRCIHCTRCVRFGQEVAGVMELGMIHRGEHAEITTVTGDTIDSELSGNMIDICPVGALTSKPFRYSARTWELSRRKSVSPHDSTGANLIVQVKNHKVMRVVPFENEAVNECWIADRDRFSYEALNSDERLTQPMLKQGGVWKEVDWQTHWSTLPMALQAFATTTALAPLALWSVRTARWKSCIWPAHWCVARAVKTLTTDCAMPNSPLPPGFAGWERRLRRLSTLQRVLVVGSNLRKDHPLFAQRIRQAARHGLLSALSIQKFLTGPCLSRTLWCWRLAQWEQALAGVAAAVAQEKGVQAPDDTVQVGDSALAIARSLLGGERKAILLGNAAAHHAHASRLLALAQWIGEHTGATVGYLTEAANTVGAQYAGAVPVNGGHNAGQMLAGSLKAAILLNTNLPLTLLAVRRPVRRLPIPTWLSP